MIYSNIYCFYNASKRTKKNEDLDKLQQIFFLFFNNFNKIIESYIQVSSVSTNKKPTLIFKSIVEKIKFEFLLYHYGIHMVINKTKYKT